MAAFGLVVLGILLLGIVYVVMTYNRGIRLRNLVREAFSTMDVYLKKRWDLIPNLVETAKGYAKHEAETFKQVAQLRNQGNYGKLPNAEKIELNAQLDAGLARLLAVVENYPELKANQQFNQLMHELSNVENDIANARKYYNATVRALNNYVQLFPSNLVANLVGISLEPMFETSEKERENVTVSF